MNSVNKWIALVGASVGGIGGFVVAGMGGSLLGGLLGGLATLIFINFLTGVVLPAFVSAAVLVAIVWLVISLWNVG